MLSCIECRVINVFSSIVAIELLFLAPSSFPIVTLTVSPSFPNLLIAVNENGTVFVWDIPSHTLRYEWPLVFRLTARSKGLVVKDVFCEADTALLQVKNRVLMTMHLPDFGTFFSSL